MISAYTALQNRVSIYTSNWFVFQILSPGFMHPPEEVPASLIKKPAGAGRNFFIRLMGCRVLMITAL